MKYPTWHCPNVQPSTHAVRAPVLVSVHAVGSSIAGQQLRSLPSAASFDVVILHSFFFLPLSVSLSLLFNSSLSLSLSLAFSINFFSLFLSFHRTCPFAPFAPPLPLPSVPHRKSTLVVIRFFFSSLLLLLFSFYLSNLGLLSRFFIGLFFSLSPSNLRSNLPINPRQSPWPLPRNAGEHPETSPATKMLLLRPPQLWNL